MSDESSWYIDNNDETNNVDRLINVFSHNRSSYERMHFGNNCSLPNQLLDDELVSSFQTANTNVEIVTHSTGKENIEPLRKLNLHPTCTDNFPKSNSLINLDVNGPVASGISPITPVALSTASTAIPGQSAVEFSFANTARPSQASLALSTENTARPGQSAVEFSFANTAGPSQAPLASSTARSGQSAVDSSFVNTARPRQAPLALSTENTARPGQSAVEFSFANTAGPSRAPLALSTENTARPGQSAVEFSFANTAGPSRAPLALSTENTARPGQSAVEFSFASTAGPSQRPLASSTASTARSGQSAVDSFFVNSAGPSQAPIASSTASTATPGQSAVDFSFASTAGPSQRPVASSTAARPIQAVSAGPSQATVALLTAPVARSSQSVAASLASTAGPSQTATTSSTHSRTPLFGAFCYQKQISIVSPSISIPLNRWLERSSKGENILTYYQSFQNLSNAFQCHLCDCVLEREVHQLEKLPKINKERYIKLTDEIIQLFPSEARGTYYCPSVPKSGLSAGVPACGKLIQQYTYMKKKNSKHQALLNRQINKSVNLTVAEEQVENSDIVAAKLSFLEKEVSPWPTVRENWQATYEARQKILETTAVHDYFERFPCLKQQLGLTLITLDFDIKYPDKAECMQSRWPILSKSLKILFTDKSNNSYKSIISKLNDPSTHQSTVDTIVIWLLPSLFRPVSNSIPCTNEPESQLANTGGKKKGSRKRKYPTTAESQEGLLLHVETANDIKDSIERLRTSMQRIKKNLQPRPVIVGPFENIEASYISINDHLLPVLNPVHAIESMLKIYFALDISYPPEAASSWKYLASAIFDFAPTGGLPHPIAAELSNTNCIRDKLLSKTS